MHWQTMIVPVAGGLALAASAVAHLRRWRRAGGAGPLLTLAGIELAVGVVAVPALLGMPLAGQLMAAPPLVMVAVVAHRAARRQLRREAQDRRPSAIAPPDA